MPDCVLCVVRVRELVGMPRTITVKRAACGDDEDAGLGIRASKLPQG